MKLVSPLGQEVTSGPRLSHPVTRDGHPIPFFPVGQRVIVERLPPDTMIAGLHVPDSAQSPTQYATVIAAGPGAQGILDDMAIAIGDTVCFGKYSGVFWEWEVKGLEGRPYGERRRRVDMINIADIFGGQELAAKMIDGRLGISLYKPEGSDESEYRFFEEVTRG